MQNEFFDWYASIEDRFEVDNFNAIDVEDDDDDEEQEEDDDEDDEDEDDEDKDDDDEDEDVEGEEEDEETSSLFQNNRTHQNSKTINRLINFLIKN